jgi:hypothetical protein
MASSLSPSSIDATFPVAGQDNDSQGFRDNFNQIKTDLTNAKSELEALQTNAILKANLTSPAVTASNDLAGLALKDYKYSENVGLVSALGTVSGSQTVTVTNGAVFTVTTSGALTLAFAGWKNTGFESVKLIITQGGAYSVALTGVTFPYLVNPDAHTVSVDSTAGLDFSTRYVFPQINGSVTVLDVFTTDGGTTKRATYPTSY